MKRPKARRVPHKPLEYREPDTTRLMRCWNEFWTGGATWRRKDGIWACVEPSPMLAWMKGMAPDAAKLELVKRGCQWEWV